MAKTAVIVKDEVLLALDLRLMCEVLRLEVIGVAHSAAEALAEISLLAPDVLLTDMQIGPGGDGVDVVEELRRSCPEATVIFVTAATDAATMARVASSCSDCILLKPVSQADLCRALTP